MHLPHLLADPSFERIGSGGVSGPLLPAGWLTAVPKQEIAWADWWDQHIVEVITGRPPGADRLRCLR